MVLQCICSKGLIDGIHPTKRRIADAMFVQHKYSQRQYRNQHHLTATRKQPGTDAYQRLLAVVTIKVLFLYAWDIPVEAPPGVAGGSQATVFGANVSDLADLHA